MSLYQVRLTLLAASVELPWEAYNPTARSRTRAWQRPRRTEKRFGASSDTERARSAGRQTADADLAGAAPSRACLGKT
jgi:hypothetical protein